MRCFSSSVSVECMSPVPRGAAAPGGSAATREAAATSATETAAAEPAAAEAADVRAGIAPEAALPVPQEDHQEEHDEEDVDRERRDRQRAPPLRVGRSRRHRLCIAAEHADDRGRAREHAAIEITALEGRGDVALDDGAAERVGEGALEAVAHLDPDPMLAWRHDQDHAVVRALLPDAPVTEQPIAEILDGKALERFQSHHHDLGPAARALEIRA